MPLYTTQGIVVRVRDLGEADKILHFLTKDDGKLAAVARGARRPKNRFAGASQLFTHVSVSLFSSSGLGSISQMEIKESFRRLREDLDRMACATYLCELVDEAVPEKQPVEDIFYLLLATLLLLTEAEADPVTLQHAFEVRLLALLGYRPHLDSCVACGRPVEGARLRFSPSLGGVLCGQCPAEQQGSFLISRGTLETVRRLLEGDLRRTKVLRFSGETRAELDRVFEEYIAWRLEKRLRSLDFLRSVREESP